nr:hypothetical protein [Tanacetum cinerariifolium]
MKSSSSSSSRSKYKRYTKEELITQNHCDCPLPIKEQVAWTITTPEEDSRDVRFMMQSVSFMVFKIVNYEMSIQTPVFKIHEENKMLKKNMAKNMGKNMAKNMKKSNSNEGAILQMGELKEELTLIK